MSEDLGHSPPDGLGALDEHPTCSVREHGGRGQGGHQARLVARVVRS